MNPPQLLTPEEQDRWLTEHIPHRVLAVLPGLILPAPWSSFEPPAMQGSPAGIRAVQFSIWEGRLTAMRWLIMLIGVGRTLKTGEVLPPHIFDTRTDVTLERFKGG